MTEYTDSDLFEVRNLVLGEEIFPLHVELALSFICMLFVCILKSTESHQSHGII